MEILLTRHGQTDWNVLKKVQGKADIELNKKGLLSPFFIEVTYERTLYSHTVL